MTKSASHDVIQPAQAWERITASLRFELGEATFNSWIKPLKFDRLDGHEVTLFAPTRFIRDWISNHYLDRLTTLWQTENPGILKVEVRCQPQEQGSVTSEHSDAIRSKHLKEVPSYKERHSAFNHIGAKLDPRFTFETFVVGPTNQLAYQAAKSIAESDAVIPGSNPLFLYGGVGLGKTHLMQAIAHHIQLHNPDRNVLYLSAEKFMYQFIQAIQKQDVVSFKAFFRSVDVLMVDDIQFICGKNSTQEEFFHTFNELIDNKKQLILSGDRSPSDLDGMEERVKSRLGWGLVADINATTFELRYGILQSKVERMDSLTVPDNVLTFLAEKITSNIRELEGALNKVIAHAKLTQQNVTLDNTQLLLRDLLRSNEKSITIDDIKRMVADHHSIRIADMHSARRSRNIARPRQIAMYLSKKLTQHSLPEIGRRFGGKDHTTVIHAVRKIESLCDESPEFREDVELLTKLLQH